MSILKYDAQSPGKFVFQFGMLLVLPVLIFTLGWMTFASLHSAAVATGQVVLTSDRQIVQHLEGGIVEAIYVTEGQKITEGSPIIQIKSTAQLAKQTILQDRIVDARATRARLLATLSGSKTIDFGNIAANLDANLVDIQKYQIRQMAQFETNERLEEQQKRLLASRISSIDTEKANVRSSLDFNQRQQEIGQEQWDIKQNLQAKGLASKSEILELQKSLVGLQSSVAENKITLEGLEKKGGTLQLEYEQLRSQTQISSFDELQQLEASLSSFEQELLTLRDQLDRSQINAPISGRILDLQVHSSGEILSPGARILDIVPDQQDLIVEAKVAPQDIDIVHPGGDAKIQLASYNVKKVPRLDGIISTVSADILTDPTTGQNYYLVRIIVDQAPLEKLKADVKLNPGMPAEVFLLSEERTVLDYLISPLTNAAYRAFRED